MNIASLSENQKIEKRIAITPEIAKKYISLGFNLTLPNNYGTNLGFTDEEYKNLGVNFSDNEEEIIKNSEIVIQLGLPVDEKLSFLKFTLFKFTIFLIFRFSANETFIDIKSKNMGIKNFFTLRKF